MAVEIPTGSPFAQGHQDPKNYGARRWEACSSDIKLESCGGEVFFFFLHSKLLNVSHRLHQGDLWLAASTALYNLTDELSGMPWKVSDDQDEDRTSPAQYYSYQRIW